MTTTIIESPSTEVVTNTNIGRHHHHHHRHNLQLSATSGGGGGFFDGVQDFFKRFTQKATASHILLKGDGAQLINQLEDWKVDINNSPVKFAEYASKYSACPSSASGGSLGEFGPGMMVPEFDKVVFDSSNDVGEVHGPVKTQFGYHLIYIRDRTE